MSKDLEARLRQYANLSARLGNETDNPLNAVRMTREAADQLERYRVALEYYAKWHPQPSEGPWGADSTDFGEVARQALEAK